MNSIRFNFPKTYEIILDLLRQSPFSLEKRGVYEDTAYQYILNHEKVLETIFGEDTDEEWLFEEEIQQWIGALLKRNRNAIDSEGVRQFLKKYYEDWIYELINIATSVIDFENHEEAYRRENAEFERDIDRLIYGS